MKKTVFAILILIFSTAIFADYGRRVNKNRYFDKNIYFYSMYGNLNSDDGWDSGYKMNQGAATFGGGFIFLRFGQKATLGFEFDYTMKGFGDKLPQETDLDVYSYTLSFGVGLDRERKSQFFFNLGISHFSYEFGNGATDGQAAMLLGAGIKYAITESIAFRGEARLYVDIIDREGYYYDDYYYDDYYYDDDRYEWRIAGASFSAGLEIRF